MRSEEDFIMISALQHLLFCERQFALIHVEGLWSENRFTVRGEAMHEKAHSSDVSCRDGVRVERGVPLRSEKLGLIGKADVVEFRERDDGSIQPFPVEYKLGRPKSNRCDEAQLCAQAICLEEMTGARIPEGALFYGRTRRRKNVVFDDELRSLVLSTTERARRLIELGATPAPEYDTARCDTCSMREMCFPKSNRSAGKFIEDILNEETS